MAISKKGFRQICVHGEIFRWKIRKKVSHSESHDDQYAIPVQHISEGQLLYLCIGFSRSEGYGRKPMIITPKIIESKIKEAIDLGWNYQQPGNPMCFMDGKLLTDTKTTRWVKS